MKKATVEDLNQLQYGDKIHLYQKGYATTYKYVGRMPSKDNYLIISCGTDLKYIHIPSYDINRTKWYIGDYDDKFIINLRISELEAELEQLKKELNQPK